MPISRDVIAVDSSSQYLIETYIKDKGYSVSYSETDPEVGDRIYVIADNRGFLPSEVISEESYFWASIDDEGGVSLDGELDDAFELNEDFYEYDYPEEAGSEGEYRVTFISRNHRAEDGEWFKATITAPPFGDCFLPSINGEVCVSDLNRIKADV